MTIAGWRVPKSIRDADIMDGMNRIDRMAQANIQILSIRSEIVHVFARSWRFPKSARVRRFALGAGASEEQMRRSVGRMKGRTRALYITINPTTPAITSSY